MSCWFYMESSNWVLRLTIWTTCRKYLVSWHSFSGITDLKRSPLLELIQWRKISYAMSERCYTQRQHLRELQGLPEPVILTSQYLDKFLLKKTLLNWTEQGNRIKKKDFVVVVDITICSHAFWPVSNIFIQKRICRWWNGWPQKKHICTLAYRTSLMSMQILQGPGCIHTSI